MNGLEGGLIILLGDVRTELKMGEVTNAGGRGVRPGLAGRLDAGTGVVGIMGIGGMLGGVAAVAGCCCCPGKP